MKIDIDLETLDGIALASLKRQLRNVKNPKYPSKLAEDIAFEKELIAAMKMLIKYYGG